MTWKTALVIALSSLGLFTACRGEGDEEAERAAIRAYVVRSGIPQLVDPGRRSGIEVQTVGRGRDLALECSATLALVLAG